MAARKLKPFYVYKIIDSDGVYYVGKGSGRRLNSQMRTFSRAGEIIERFEREADALAAERRYIAELKPRANKCAGGNGNRKKKGRTHSYKWVREIEKVGTRVYAARLALAVHRQAPHLVDPSIVDALRRVAYGHRA